MMRIVNVILAGGASRRFGEPKASHVYQGKPLYEHVKEQLLKGETSHHQSPEASAFFQSKRGTSCLVR